MVMNVEHERETVGYNVEAGIAPFTLNRPRACNALNRQMIRELLDVGKAASTELIFTGEAITTKELNGFKKNVRAYRTWQR